eukprot:680864-Amorphochlora_amoeboformis.AAC.1
MESLRHIALLTGAAILATKTIYTWIYRPISENHEVVSRFLIFSQSQYEIRGGKGVKKDPR